jgi:hypothetical protein
MKLAVAVGAMIALLAPSCFASEPCGVEVKVVVSPSEKSRAVEALGLKKEQKGEVFFYDTKALDLFKQGVILRIRRGEADNDLTVKLRPPNESSFSDPSNGKEDFKCEGDLNNGAVKPSYSIKNDFSKKAPDSGEDFEKHLSKGQKKLLEAAAVSVPWKQVKRIANVRSTNWERKKTEDTPKLSMELWQWKPSGSVLEMSVKVEESAAHSAETQLKQIATSNSLTLVNDSKSKTRAVLESFAASEGNF